MVSSEVAFAMEDATELFSSDSLNNITTDTIEGAMLQSPIDRLQRQAGKVILYRCFLLQGSVQAFPGFYSFHSERLTPTSSI